MRVLWSVVLAVGVLGACSGGDEAANGAPGSGCTGRTGSCASTSHGVCVEVQMSQGHCVDWSAAGATPCAGDPADCPSSAPSTTFPLGEAASTSVACIAADGTMQFGGALLPEEPRPGYCMAFQTISDESGQAECTPDLCGSGYCSWLQNDAGTSYVTCTWPF